MKLMITIIRFNKESENQGAGAKLIFHYDDFGSTEDYVEDCLYNVRKIEHKYMYAWENGLAPFDTDWCGVRTLEASDL